MNDKCYRCGTDNAPDAMHCKRCGFAMEPRQPYDRFASEDRTCPWCGRGDDADAVFCDQCGKRLPAGAALPLANRSRALNLAGKTGSYRPPAVPRYKPTGALRKATSASMRKLAADLESRHADLGAHIHVRDAANALDRNEPEAATRHLTAAIGNMTPQSLMRHGLLTDEHHDAAKRSMDAIHRHLLLVKDVQDMQAHNNTLPRQGEFEDDNLDEKPSAGDFTDKAMNAPDKTPTGGPDPSVAGPKSVTKWEVTKQVATSNSGDLTTAIDLAHHFDPMQPRGKDGKWVNAGMGVASAFETVGAHDPSAMVAVGGGRRNWGNEASQMPDQLERLNHPEAARRSRLITPARVLAAQMDQTRMENGQKPLHPELAEIWPNIYGPHGYTAKPGTLSVPKAPRVVKDKYSATGIDSSGMTKTKIGVRAGLAKKGQGLLYGTPLSNYPTTAVNLSAQTARLAVTPSPRGKPGGPGLYNVKGNEHSPYLQNIVKALIRNGHPPGQAYAIARGSIRRWARGGGKVHPEVRAAAGAAEAQEDTAQARAHAHSSTPAMRRLIDLVGTSAGAAKDSRTPLGTFGSGGSAPAKGGQAKPDAHQQHVAHEKTVAAKKAALVKQAAGYRAQADALIKQRDTLRAELSSASGKTSSGQKGSKTSSNATTKSSAPASSSSSTSSAKSSTSSAKSSTSSSSSKKSSGAALNSQIAALNSQIVALQQKYKATMAQAAKL